MPFVPFELRFRPFGYTYKLVAAVGMIVEGVVGTAAMVDAVVLLFLAVHHTIVYT